MVKIAPKTSLFTEEHQSNIIISKDLWNARKYLVPRHYRLLNSSDKGCLSYPAPSSVLQSLSIGFEKIGVETSYYTLGQVDFLIRHSRLLARNFGYSQGTYMKRILESFFVGRCIRDPKELIMLWRGQPQLIHSVLLKFR